MENAIPSEQEVIDEIYGRTEPGFERRRQLVEAADAGRIQADEELLAKARAAIAAIDEKGREIEEKYNPPEAEIGQNLDTLA